MEWNVVQGVSKLNYQMFFSKSNPAEHPWLH